MSKRRSHKLELSHWEKQMLLVEELMFATLEEAREHAEKEEHNHKHKKVYDWNGEVVHSQEPKHHHGHHGHHGHGHHHESYA
jgi:hypothetical protein